jgi:hypothetical protein
MTRIKQTLKTPLNGRNRTVTAALCPTPGQHAKSVLIQALRTTETRDYPPGTEVLAAQTKAGNTVFTYR